MNIAVIGATGITGLAFVRQALARGHAVTALARSPEKITISDPCLTVIKGDVLNPADVKKVVLGKDAVFIALGTGPSTGKSTIRTDGTHQVVNVLEAANEQPLVVVLSSLGANESIRQMPIYVRLPIKLMLGRVFADHSTQEEAVTASSLPYVFLRPTYLTEKDTILPVTATPAPKIVKAMPSISRASVAAFALQQIEKRPTQSAAYAITHG